jgi:pimeloyl-ACP methyl ester carboxylesterase
MMGLSSEIKSMTVFIWFCLGLITIYLGLCLILWLGQRRIIFEPHFQSANPIPANLSLVYDSIRLPVGQAGAEYLVAWWFPHGHPNGQTMLFLHGNSGYDDYNFNTLNIMHQLGFDVLMLNYRGYGESSQRFPNERRVYEDAATGYRFLIEQKQVLPENLLIYGHSLGGAIAIEIASRYRCGGLFIESTFASMLEMSVTKSYMKFFPINWLLHQRFDSRRKVPELKIPLFFCHGTEDETIPTFMSERLMAIANEPKRLEIIPGADHHNLSEVGAKTVHDGIQWLQSQLV